MTTYTMRQMVLTKKSYNSAELRLGIERVSAFFIHFDPLSVRISQSDVLIDYAVVFLTVFSGFPELDLKKSVVHNE